MALAPTPPRFGGLRKGASTTNTLANKPKDSMIINRKRLPTAKPSIDKLAPQVKSSHTKAKPVETRSSDEYSTVDDSDDEDDEKESSDKFRVTNEEGDSNSDSGSSSEENSEAVEDSDLEEDSRSVGNSSQGDESESLSVAKKEAKNDDTESEIDLEEEDDEEAGIDYEEMQVDSDNEDLGAMIKRKVVKNDEKALLRLLDIMKEKSGLQMNFFETQVIQSSTPTQIEEVNDDIGLEVELYKQALQSAKEAYTTFERASKPFFRPDDYFAEMIKSDAHMEKIRLKLVSEMENIKASEESKKKRNLKKFGKAIQVEKKLEREKESKRVQEGVKELRKKRKDVPSLESINEVDFDISLEETLSNKRARHDNGQHDKSSGSQKKPKMNRVGREQKFGRPKPKGVTGRRWKENTKESSSHFEGLGGRGDGNVMSGIASRGRGGRGGLRGGSSRGGSSRGGGSGGRGGKSRRPGKSMRTSKR